MDYEKEGLLHEIFSRQAKKTPDKVAVVTADGRETTFAQLDEWTDLLGDYLRIKGVKPNTIVGIYMEKCLEFTISYIAILKAGGGYMPMDVSYPVPLLADIMSDAQPVAVFADPDLAQFIPSAKNVIFYGEGWQERIKKEITESGPVPEPEPLTLDNLAYTVYSSGTTGKPKGIQCPHRGAVFSYTHRHVTYPQAPDEREACNVFFTWEMLRPLLRGITLYIIPDNVIYDPRLLCEFVKRNSITRILFTPSLLEAVLDTEGVDVADCMKSMRSIVFCGEVVTVGLLDRCVKTLPHVQFINLYSISESHDVACTDLTVWCKQEKDMKNKKFCPVGKLLPGVSVVILDDDLKTVPVGVPGEIYIGGPTLAIGYLNRPELNKTRFIPKPDSVPAKVGDRLYKAGDWGYMLSDGSFEICGRCDSMVKIRGYSIETQAVEAALLELAIVNACVVIVQGEEGEDKYLVSYIVPEGKVTKKIIRAELKKRLPFYMIPSYFVFLASIPILPASGKLDKKQLPPVDKTEHLDEEGMPSTDTERALVPLWTDVLQLKRVDVQESFFDLGGHSLLATKLLTKVKEKFDLELNVKDLFIYSSVSTMAKLIDSKCQKTAGRDSPEIVEPALDLLTEVNRHDQEVSDMDIHLRAFWRSTQYTDKWHKARVLLTGATGFLGSFLLRDLLTNTETNIYCLVRELPDKPGKERIRTSLVQYGILPADPATASKELQLLDMRFNHRVTALKGDVGLINMGLSEEDYTYFCTEVDFIIHAAAYVNLIYPYQALHGPNVLGTQNVIKFCCTSKIKPLHYISTDGVFPSGLHDCGEDDDMNQYAPLLEDGYSQSKWVAEQLVRRAMDRGLPAVIYRLGNQGGESETAYWNAQDFNLLMMQGCLFTGQAPDIDWDIELTPVDFVSDTIVTLTQQMGLSLGNVLNFVNTKTLKFRWLVEWYCAHGYKLNVVDFDTWKQSLASAQRKSKSVADLSRMLDGMIKDASFFTKLSTYRQENLERILTALDRTYPEMTNSLLHTYFMNLARRRVIPKMRRNTIVDKPLEGQVAIVTGCSSGMGEAIATHLARAGAQVAMAARREDKLHQVKKNIESEGGVAIAVKCDVTNRSDVAELVKRTECTLGNVSILVNNAGVMYYQMMKNLNEDEWHRQIDVNCKGVVNCIGATLDGMLKREKGHIVNITSNAGKRGFAGLAVYSGTKFFVEGLSQGMRSELAQTGVKVTCIQPGDVKTELLQHSTDMEAKDAFDCSGSNKILEPADIARAVVYAVSQPEYVGLNEILIEPRTAPI